MENAAPGTACTQHPEPHLPDRAEKPPCLSPFGAVLISARWDSAPDARFPPCCVQGRPAWRCFPSRQPRATRWVWGWESSRGAAGFAASCPYTGSTALLCTGTPRGRGSAVRSPPGRSFDVTGSCSQPSWSLCPTLMDPASNLRGSCTQPSWIPHPTLMDPASDPRGSRTQLSWILQSALVDPASDPLGSCIQPLWIPHPTLVDPAPNPHGACTQPSWILQSALMDPASDPLGSRSQPLWILHPTLVDPASNPCGSCIQLSWILHPTPVDPAVSPHGSCL